LSSEALGSVLPRGFHQLGKALRRLVRMRRDRAVDRTLELLDLTARDVLEAGAHAVNRIGLLPLCLLGQLALPARQPILELVERAPPLGGVCFELAPHLPECILERAVEIGAQASHAPP